METEKVKDEKSESTRRHHRREVKVVLSFPKLPLEKVTQVLQNYPRARILEDGRHEVGYHIRLELEGGKKLEGWLSELDHQQFRLEALTRRWPGALPFSVK